MFATLKAPARLDMKLGVVVLGVSDVDRARAFYENLGWRLDADSRRRRLARRAVDLEPGQEDAPHRHPGAAFGYVLEGEYEWAIDDNPVKTLCLHRVSKNPSKKGKTRILAVVLHPADVKDIVIPKKDKSERGPRAIARGPLQRRGPAVVAAFSWSLS